MPESVAAVGTAVVGAFSGGGAAAAVGTAVAGGLASATLSSILAPKQPNMQNPNQTLAATPVAGMPDPLAEQQQQQQQITQTQALRGRASTILTSPGGGSQTLGG